MSSLKSIKRMIIFVLFGISSLVMMVSISKGQSISTQTLCDTVFDASILKLPTSFPGIYYANTKDPFTTGDSTYIFEKIDGTQTTEISSPFSQEIASDLYQPSVSPDGRLILFRPVEGNQLVIWDTTTNETTNIELTAEEVDYLLKDLFSLSQRQISRKLIWNGSSKIVIQFLNESSNAIQAVTEFSVKRSPLQITRGSHTNFPITPSIPDQAIYLSPYGNYKAVVSPQSISNVHSGFFHLLEIYEISTNRLVFSLPPTIELSFDGEPYWSDDETYLIFSGEKLTVQNSDIVDVSYLPHVIDLGTGSLDSTLKQTLETLFGERVSMSPLTQIWSNSKTKFAFEVYRTQTHENYIIVYERSTNTLKAICDEYEIGNSNYFYPFWSPDDQYVGYWYNGQVIIYSTQIGEGFSIPYPQGGIYFVGWPTKVPIANAGADQIIQTPGVNMVTLDGSASYDPDGIIVSYSWMENGQQIATEVSPTANLTGGLHTITLVVTDNNGAVSEDTVVVKILPPTANPGADQTVTTADGLAVAVTLDGSGSSDPDGTIEGYEWKENGATIATGVNPTVNLSPGVHDIYLTVTDDSGLSATSQTPVKVTVIGYGWIVYTSNRNGNSDIYAFHPPSNSLVQLTTSSDVDSLPVWSPNRDMIAYVSNSAGSNDIWILKLNEPASSTNPSRLGTGDTNSVYDDTQPAWSSILSSTRHLSRIAFASNRGNGQDIYYVEVDGTTSEIITTARRVTTASGVDKQPDWSPNGNVIVYSSNVGGTNGYDLFKVTIGSSGCGAFNDPCPAPVGLVELDGDDEQPVWTPYGGANQYIAFTRKLPSETDFEIFVVSSAGGSPKRLTNNGYNDQFMAWSPDATVSSLTFVYSSAVIEATDQNGSSDPDLYTLTLTNVPAGTLTIGTPVYLGAANSESAETQSDW